MQNEQNTPLPKPTSQPRARGFQARVDYAAKAIKRGSWGRRFEACFEEADAKHVAAVLVLRAEKNPDLKNAIMSAFKVKTWADVPWVKAMSRFSGMNSQEIGQDAERVRGEVDRVMGAELLLRVCEK